MEAPVFSKCLHVRESVESLDIRINNRDEILAERLSELTKEKKKARYNENPEFNEECQLTTKI